MRRYEYLTNSIGSTRIFIWFLISLFVISSCNRNRFYRVTSETDLVKKSVSTRSIKSEVVSGKIDPTQHYIPYDSLDHLFPTKYIRLNFHYMNDSEGDKNYTGKEAEEFTYYLVDNANKRLLENHKMKLPLGNATPTLNPRYQYIIQRNTEAQDDNGIYFHTDDDLYYFINKGKKKNNYKRKVIDKYAINLDSVLNVFVMPHHPDSVRQKNYNVSTTGIALGNAIKISGLYEKGEPFWEYATLLNHEIGHVFGLSHTWSIDDGCEDTPKNNNCFTKTAAPPCDKEVSNNLMDYNSSQMSITPCQLGIIHKNIARLGNRVRGLVRPDWCKYQLEKTIVIDSNQKWNGNKDLYGDLIIESGSTLQISGRISLPKGAKIVVEKNAKLILKDCLLHNACGQKWGGIECKSIDDIIADSESKILDVISNTNYKSPS